MFDDSLETVKHTRADQEMIARWWKFSRCWLFLKSMTYLIYFKFCMINSKYYQVCHKFQNLLEFHKKKLIFPALESTANKEFNYTRNEFLWALQQDWSNKQQMKMEHITSRSSRVWELFFMQVKALNFIPSKFISDTSRYEQINNKISSHQTSCWTWQMFRQNITTVRCRSVR